MKTPTLSVVALLLGLSLLQAKDVTLLNVSYDATREFYTEYNAAFVADWKKQTGDTVTIQQAHGGSGKQARAVIDGLAADVVTLGLAPDIDAIVKNAHSIAPGWQTRLPNDSAPYTSTVVLVVRKGNPKGIKDWADLTKPGVEVVTANPKTGGGARWNFLAAYGYALDANGQDEAKARDFIKALYGNVKVLDESGRGSTITFVQRSQGDVLIAWEDEALLTVKKLNPDQFEIVYPSETILTEPPVAVVDVNVDKHGTRKEAEGYLKYLYSPDAQDIIARHYFRPSQPDILAKYASQFPILKLFTVKDKFGDWAKVQKAFFSDNGVFDQIYKSAKTTPAQ